MAGTASFLLASACRYAREEDEFASLQPHEVCAHPNADAGRWSGPWRGGDWDVLRERVDSAERSDCSGRRSLHCIGAVAFQLSASTDLVLGCRESRFDSISLICGVRTPKCNSGWVASVSEVRYTIAV